MKKAILSATLILALGASVAAFAQSGQATACPRQNCASCPCPADSCTNRPCPQVCPLSGVQVCPEEMPCGPRAVCARPPMPDKNGDVWTNGCFQPGQGSPCTPGCNLTAGQGRPDGPRGPHGRWHDGPKYKRGFGIGPRLTEGLDLTPEQQVRMQQIEARHKASFDKERKQIQQKQIKLRKEAKKKMDKQRADMQKDFLKILTPEQRKVYEQNLQDRTPRCKAKGSVKLSKPMPVPQPPMQYAAPSKDK